MVLNRFTNILGAGIRAVRLYDEQNNRANVDRISESLGTIDVLHHRIHQGVVYSHNQILTAVANDASVNLLLQVPASHAAHLRAVLAAGGDAELRLFEGTTFSNAGTGVTPRNRNRFAGDNAQLTVSHTPTITGDGTELSTVFVPGGRGGNAGGGTGGLFAEYVLNVGTNYLLRGTNRAGQRQNLNLQVTWYEPNGDDPS